MRQSWTGPRLAGAFLLAASVAILLAVFAIPGRGGYTTSGPRFVPLLVAIGLDRLLAHRRTGVASYDIRQAERKLQESIAEQWRRLKENAK